LRAMLYVCSAPGTDFAERLLAASRSWSPPHSERDLMHVLDALTAHIAYPLDVYIDAACLTMLAFCGVGVPFVGLGRWLLPEPGVRADAHRQRGEGGCAPQSGLAPRG